MSLAVNAHADKRQEVEAEARKAASKWGVDPDLYVAIIKVESSLYQGAYNKKTADYGAAQVNKQTAKLYGFDLKRLKSDSKYNLDAGARILADFKKSHPDSYICRYNVGTGKLVGKRMLACLKYNAKVWAALTEE